MLGKLLIICLLLTGCTSTSHWGGRNKLDVDKVRIFLPQFTNATDDEHAGRAVTELTASALMERHLPLVQFEGTLISAREEGAMGAEGLYAPIAAKLAATHILVGTVHEYRYKTDLDGDPAVGITLRLVQASDGRTIWQGTSGNVDVLFASLTRAAQFSSRRLVGQMPFNWVDRNMFRLRHH